MEDFNSLNVRNVWEAVHRTHPNSLMRVTYISRKFPLEKQQVTVVIERICRLNIKYKGAGKGTRKTWMTHPYSNIFTIVEHKTTGEKYLQITSPIKPRQAKVKYYIDGKFVRDNATKRMIEIKQKELGLAPKSIEGVKSFVKPLNCILKIEKYNKK